VYGLVVLCSIQNSSQILSKSQDNLIQSFFVFVYFNVYSLPQSVSTFVIPKGKKLIAFFRNNAAVQAFLLSCSSKYIILVALSIATCRYRFLPSIFGQYVISTCINHGSYFLNF